VLPVESQRGTRYGVGLVEVRKHDLHNARSSIFVAPTFSHLPWYADHPSDPAIRQETYLLKVVLPFVENNYPASAFSRDRLLLGFSKSGWGAWSLLLRHPDIFGRAAAWDAPLMMQHVDRYGAPAVFATQEHFDDYRLSDVLTKKSGRLAEGERLILTGYGGFRKHHRQMHDLLIALEIPHTFRDGPERKHDWHSGWIPEAVDLLFAPRTNPAP
jgi:enterochelin esterase-like enzyme